MNHEPDDFHLLNRIIFALVIILVAELAFAFAGGHVVVG